MVDTNEHTGHRLVSKPTSTTYADGWDMIYGKKEEKESSEVFPPTNIKPTVTNWVLGCNDCDGSQHNND